MSEPYLSEIRIFGFNFPPRGWAHCEGQLLPINQNQSLYSLLGTTFGGDGRTTFGLPDLRGRTPIHWNAQHPPGQKDGAPTHTLQLAEMPSHTHGFVASQDSASSPDPTGSTPASAPPSLGTPYAPAPHPVSLAADAIGEAGAGSPHSNMQPYLGLYFSIAIQGLFPPRN